MKNLKFLSLTLGILAIAGVTLTSCDDDDDNNRGLTPQEVQTAFSTVRGAYNGKAIYSATNPNDPKDVTDTVTVSWEIDTDSMMTIHNFPVSAIGNSVADTVASKALLAAGSRDLQCYIGFINLSPITFLVNPIAPEFTLTYGGASHKIQIPFYVNNYYSYGQYSSGKMVMQVVAAAIYVDGNDSGWIQRGSGVPFAFVTE